MQKMQTSQDMFWLLYVLCMPLFWKETTSREERWGWQDEVSVSSAVPDIIHGKSLLDHLILACANVPCCVFKRHKGSTSSLAALLHSTPCQESFSYTQHFPHCFTPCFQLKILSLHHPLLILVIVLYQLLCLFSVSRYFCRAAGTGGAVFAALCCLH